MQCFNNWASDTAGWPVQVTNCSLGTSPTSCARHAVEVMTKYKPIEWHANASVRRSTDRASSRMHSPAWQLSLSYGPPTYIIRLPSAPAFVGPEYNAHASYYRNTCFLARFELTWLRRHARHHETSISWIMLHSASRIQRSVRSYIHMLCSKSNGNNWTNRKRSLIYHCIQFWMLHVAWATRIVSQSIFIALLLISF